MLNFVLKHDNCTGFKIKIYNFEILNRINYTVLNEGEDIA